jgi:hypothetical protein
MRSGWKVLLVVLCAAGGASLGICGQLYAWREVRWLWTYLIPAGPPAQPMSRKKQVTPSIDEAELAGYIGATAEEVVKRMELGEAEWFWTDEPPLTLRGVTYFPDQGRLKGAKITLFIDSQEPLHRQSRAMRNPSYEEFLRCRVGGIHFFSAGDWFDVGPDVPWQWWRNQED